MEKRPPERSETEEADPNIQENESRPTNTLKFKALTEKLLGVSRAELADQEKIWARRKFHNK